jgi:hypothetical protein
LVFANNNKLEVVIVIVIWRFILAVWGVALVSLAWSLGRATLQSGLSGTISFLPLFLGAAFMVGFTAGIVGPKWPRLRFTCAVISTGSFLTTVDLGWYQLFWRSGDPVGALSFYASNPKLGYDTIVLPVFAAA